MENGLEEQRGAPAHGKWGARTWHQGRPHVAGGAPARGAPARGTWGASTWQVGRRHVEHAGGNRSLFSDKTNPSEIFAFKILLILTNRDGTKMSRAKICTCIKFII